MEETKITDQLTDQERGQLLRLARQSIERVACGEGYLSPDLDGMSPRLRAPGACFVTLTRPDGELRGCIGGLEAVRPLALDVCEHAAAAAVEDYRFMPVRPEEVPDIRIEISRLTPPQPLEYDHPEDLPGLLHPNLDGVVLHDMGRRATFLPQVWEKLPDPRAFLSHLCQKMGLPSDQWRRRKMQVEIYHVEEFHE
jgi:AmmeMemoRadiSam system protein A